MAVMGLIGQIWGAFIVSGLKIDSSKSDTLIETRRTDSSQSATMAGSERARVQR